MDGSTIGISCCNGFGEYRMPRFCPTTKRLNRTYDESIKHNVEMPFNALSSIQLFTPWAKKNQKRNVNKRKPTKALVFVGFLHLHRLYFYPKSFYNVSIFLNKIRIGNSAIISNNFHRAYIRFIAYN